MRRFRSHWWDEYWRVGLNLADMSNPNKRALIPRVLHPQPHRSDAWPPPHVGRRRYSCVCKTIEEGLLANQTRSRSGRKVQGIELGGSREADCKRVCRRCSGRDSRSMFRKRALQNVRSIALAYHFLKCSRCVVIPADLCVLSYRTI